MFAIPEKMRGALLVRIIFGFFSDILLYMAFVYTSYSKAMCIFFLNTLMTPFFATCIIKEKLNKLDLIGILFGFFGMVLIIQPWRDSNDVSF